MEDNQDSKKLSREYLLGYLKGYYSALGLKISHLDSKDKHYLLVKYDLITKRGLI